MFYPHSYPQNEINFADKLNPKIDSDLWGIM